MCTVSFIPTINGNVITSNRDENLDRGAASTPKIEKFGDVEICFPQDSKSGGTWIAIKSNGVVAVLLNGAFEAHQKQDAYRESRGVILLTILKAARPLAYFKQLNLVGIENFTLILYQKNKLVECRWDGIKKYIATKNHKVPNIRSSATLYTPTVRQKREQWFNNWLASTPLVDQEKIISFHRFAGDEDVMNNLVMERENGITTVSITSVNCTQQMLTMVYKDLKLETSTNINLVVDKANWLNFVNNVKLKIRIAVIKIFNWEYWPMHLVYAPMYIYWLYLSAKARSLFFFSAANPLRANAGFAMECKSDSYRYLPQQFFPTTLVCTQGTSLATLKADLEKLKLSFPLIAKPEMGERGTGVKLMNNWSDLADYTKNCQTEFLVQQFIEGTNEVGVFYCRLPGEKRGRITGIVGKQLLTVVGDGKATIKEFLTRNNRHLLQLHTLEKELGIALHEVLAVGDERVVVPCGNHCRGAMFTDLSYLASEKLNKVIDHVCQKLPSFYFGRLDIKFNSWDEFENGINFSIIELNGAASEPTHMYDPKHSIFFAWKEIKKHWDLLFQISLANAKQNNIPLMSTAQGLRMLKAHTQHAKVLAHIK